MTAMQLELALAMFRASYQPVQCAEFAAYVAQKYPKDVNGLQQAAIEFARALGRTQLQRKLVDSAV